MKSPLGTANLLVGRLKKFGEANLPTGRFTDANQEIGGPGECQGRPDWHELFFPRRGIVADPRAAVPCVGASGGTSGILAYYCLRFLTACVGFVGWFRWCHVPVRLMFAAWVATQIIDAYRIREGMENVAVFAHLGGAAIGVLFWWWAQRAVATGALQQEIS